MQSRDIVNAPRTTVPRSSPAGRWLIVAAAVLWSTGGVFGKAPLFHEWPPEARGLLLAFWRALFAGAIVLPVARQRSWSWSLGPMVLCFAAMNICYLTSLGLTTAANAIWLQSTAPFWVCLLGTFLLKEPLRRSDAWQMVWVGLGIGIILLYELRGQAGMGVFTALASGLFYGGVVLFLRGHRHSDAAWLVAVNHLCTAALLAPYLLLRGTWPSAPQLAVLAGFGVVQMGLPYVLFTMGLRSVPAVEASGIVLLEPVLLPYLVFLVWGETPTWWTLVGGACILVGLLQRYAASRRAWGR